MKKIILTLSIILIGFSAQSQEIKKNKNAKEVIKVDGICGMCKSELKQLR